MALKKALETEDAAAQWGLAHLIAAMTPLITTFTLLFLVLITASLSAQQKDTAPHDTVAVKGVEDTVQVEQSEPVTISSVDSVVAVTQHVGGFGDFARVYLLPGLGTLFLGVCAFLLTALRSWAKLLFARMRADAEAEQESTRLKQQQDAKFQEILSETNARTLVAAANAQMAAARAEELGRTIQVENQSRAQELREVRDITLRTEHNTNSALEKALRQIERLSEQLLDKGERPEKGNGG